MNNIDLEQFIIGLSKVQLHCALGKVTLKDPINYALRSQNLQVDDDFRLTVLQDKTKFKIDDWIVDSDGTLLLVKGINRYTYTLVRNVDDRQFERGIDSIEINCHIWTIKDAKDGDVLATDNGGVFIFDGTLEEGKWPFAYCGIARQGFETYNVNLPFTHDSNSNICPATKEQHDILFKKMHDAGYEWDAVNKELIQRPFDDIEQIMYDYLSSDTCGELPKIRMREVAINRAKEIREQLK